MDAAALRASPVGSLHPITGRATVLDRDFDSFAFVPAPLPTRLHLQSRTVQMLGDADRAMGRLDAAASRLPDPNLLVRPAIRREAVSTSALEGTYATFREVLEADYRDERDRSAEVREVLNYVRAAERGLELVQELPISLRVLCELQPMIVAGTGGDGWDAGRLRTTQVYIGEPLLGIEGSRFVPPPPAVLREGIEAWESWVNAEDEVPLLAKVALGHYQLETLHPFRDGNGRLGRFVITLQLMSAGALRYPVLNLSPWLEARKEHYRDGLLRVSQTGDWDTWLQFFLAAVQAQSDDGVRRIDELLALRAGFSERVRADGGRGVVVDIVDDLIAYPVLTATEAARLHGVTYPPAARAIERLVRLGILREVTGGSYGKVYACDPVVRIVERPAR